jgi:hypothetical protein
VREKTLALISSYKPGTDPSPFVESYDVEEMQALGSLLSKLVYSPSSLRKYLQDNYDLTITRADFYSEIPGISEIEQSFGKQSLLNLSKIFPDNETMVAELQALMPASLEFKPPKKQILPDQFAWEGGPFGYSDAMAYYSMVRNRKPRTIVEIGSGWSTLIAREACKANGFGRIVCIEPYPSDALKSLSDIELVQRKAQDIETDFIDQNLSDGDILFIDSTHTVKHDSDCLHIYLRLLPNISSNITVHVHDIHLPNTLSLSTMRDHQIFWNEQYILYAYILMNPRVRIIFGSAYHKDRNKALLELFMHERYASGGASLWFEQNART